jgi:membrane peptidoglycan carboxypeptidase
MAIADTVWGRLARFNPPRRQAKERRQYQPPSLLGLVKALRVLVVLAILGLLGWAAYWEMQTSHVQAIVFERLNRGLGFGLQPGPSEAIRFPKHGPYDERLGYLQLPQFVSSLQEHRFEIAEQSRWSEGLLRFVKLGAFPIYKEKDQTGLRIYDRNGDQIYGAKFPERVYPDYQSVPDLVVRSLLFIEDRYLFDRQEPERNAAIEWNRFFLAIAGRVGGWIIPGLKEGGGSTLATQIEKFRHSPRGLTGGVGEKLRQMVTASAHVYSGGRKTFARRQEIVTTYLNSTPLSSMPGYGEIIGLPEALWVWFGTELADANRALTTIPRTRGEMARKGEVYRQVLSLILAERRPSYYLLQDRDALGELTDSHLRLLADNGIIDPQLRDAALAADLKFRDQPPLVSAVSYVKQKSTEEVRNRLVYLLGLPDLYALDRIDMTAETSVDTAAQARVTALMQRLGERKFLAESGMVGHNLLAGGEDPSKITWSFVLYERGADRNFLRIHADSLNKPFDINSGAKLQLGSTAKLRTLVTYLDIMTTLHRRFATLAPRELTKQAAAAQDPLTGWAATYLAKTRDRSLQSMLDAAMQRQYSGSPEMFFTGGGVQSFGNFESEENYGTYSVEQAFYHSVNLSYVRILRDIRDYYTAQSGTPVKRLLEDPDNPDREAYLRRFADADGKRFMTRYYKDLKGLSPEQILEELVERTPPVARRIATVYLSLYPDARLTQFKAFMQAHLPRGELDEQKLWELYLSCSPEKLNLRDRGYVSGHHPLELWLASYLQKHPEATWQKVLDASADARQEIYSWLFSGGWQKQDTRIRILLEQDAFARIYEKWRQVGYPFSHLIPSLGTAIGASGDRPDALAELMGIILNNGVRMPTASIEKLHFAANTPYDTTMAPAGQPEQVIAPEVAQTIRRALMGVVAQGTARRLTGTYKGSDGNALLVGGKTGTGDNRFHHFARGGGIISSRVVDRTATFVFFLGDRFYGSATAYVPGQAAANFHFTSALAVQLVKILEPELKPLLDSPPSADTKGIAVSAKSQPHPPAQASGSSAKP